VWQVQQGSSAPKVTDSAALLMITCWGWLLGDVVCCHVGHCVLPGLYGCALRRGWDWHKAPTDSSCQV
jgi:hypothetical protein